MEIIVAPNGDARCLYGEELNLGSIGTISIRRASFCEPDMHGSWWNDLSPSGGPILGPYNRRTQAIEAEVDWLRRNILFQNS